MTSYSTVARIFFALVLTAMAASAMARADVHVPAIFGSHMVLQQDKKIPVWGTADAGEEVTVRIGGESAKATTGADKKWRVNLKPLTATQPLTLTISGKNKLTFDDVLVGDVWVCSGQSNMEFPEWRAHDSAAEIPKANEPNLRLFLVTRKIADQPMADVVGQWQLCSPTTIHGFSAVGYYFGRELSHTLNRPIGLIGTYWGGMPAQAFTSLSGLEKPPAFSKYVDDYKKVVANYDKAKADYPASKADFDKKAKEWNDTVGVAYQATLKQWNADVATAKAAGQPLPVKPQPTPPAPKAPPGPEGAANTPTVLFDGMIAPLIPFGIKGVIWYQGESNAGNGHEYATLFPRMISDWREKWGEGDFPFLYVQLANYMEPQVAPSEGGWAWLREAQTKTLSLPATGMAVIIDIGNPNDIHPTDKNDVGMRLALAAKHVAYQQDLVYSGPIYSAMKVEGNKIRVSFKDTGTGLKIGAAPWSPDGTTPVAGTELKGFAIAGKDYNWVWAKAEIDGKDVVVSSDTVLEPVAVRYGWANDPPCNLYNNEGLPASPFRTDDQTDYLLPPKPAAPATNAPAASPVAKP